MLTDSSLRPLFVGLTVCALLATTPVFAQDAATEVPAAVAQPPLVEGQVWAVVGEGEARRLVVSFGIAGDEGAPPTPACWANGAIDFTQGPDCPASVPAGDSLAAGWNSDLPAAFAVVTANGWCVPTFGEPTVYNTAECENGYQIGLPLLDCTASAPFAVAAATAVEVESWPAWHWSGVDFGEQQSVDITTVGERTDLPREVLTWWSPIVDRYQYEDVTVEGAMRIGRAVVGADEWWMVSSAAHLPGADCTDRVLFHGGMYVNSEQGLRTTSRGGIMTDLIYGEDGQLLYGVHESDSSMSLVSLHNPAGAQALFYLGFRFDNEECASHSTGAWLENNCGP